MFRVTGVLFFCFVIAGCSPDGEEIIKDVIRGLGGIEIDSEGEYTCRDGNASLPAGEHPEDTVTPPEYVLHCDDATYVLFADGTLVGLILPQFPAARARMLAYWQQCKDGTRPPELTGEWVVTETGACMWLDITPGLYFCLEGTVTYGEPTAPDNLSGKVVGLSDTRMVFFDEHHKRIGTSGPFTCRLRK